MPFTAKTIAQGSADAAESVIHTVPADSSDYVKSFTVYNTSPDPQVVVVKINGYHWRRVELANQDEFAELLTDSATLELEDGAEISLSATDDAAVEYTITGVREA